MDCWGRRLVLAAAVVWGGCGGGEGLALYEEQPQALLLHGTHPLGIHTHEEHLETIQVTDTHPNNTHPYNTHLNGIHLNGIHLNGPGLGHGEAGRLLASVSYLGAWVETEGEQVALQPGREGPERERREPLGAVWLEGSALHALQGEWRRSGSSLTGVHLRGRLGDGGQVELRVDGVSGGSGPEGDVWAYQVSWRVPGEPEWQPLCGQAPGGAQEALALAGRWDYRQGAPGEGGSWHEDEAAFTLACEGSALAKCVRLGYRPWASVGGVALRAYHQACTRLIRADLCGDGSSHTLQGQPVNLYDAVGVQQDEAAWATEAEWDEGGARCQSSPGRAREWVSCAERGPLPSCEPQGPGAGALLRSEAPGSL